MNTIRALRQEHGWTQFELALRLGVQPQAVCHWETGRRRPHVPHLRKLGQLCGICSDEIVLIEPARTALAGAVQQPHASRHPGEPTTGRDTAGSAAVAAAARPGAARPRPPTPP